MKTQKSKVKYEREQMQPANDVEPDLQQPKHNQTARQHEGATRLQLDQRH